MLSFKEFRESVYVPTNHDVNANRRFFPELLNDLRKKKKKKDRVKKLKKIVMKESIRGFKNVALAHKNPSLKGAGITDIDRKNTVLDSIFNKKKKTKPVRKIQSRIKPQAQPKSKPQSKQVEQDKPRMVYGETAGERMNKNRNL